MDASLEKNVGRTNGIYIYIYIYNKTRLKL